MSRETESGLAAAMGRIGEKLRRAREKGGEGEPRDPREVLRERAQALARAQRPAQEEGERLQVVEFALGKERFAVEARAVKEVFVLRGLVRVPCTPPFVAGVVNLRGTILSVVDLRPVLELSGDGGGTMDKVLLLSDGEREFGILAERVEGAREVPAGALSPPLSPQPEGAPRFRRGVLPGLISFLDAPLLLASPEMRVEGRKEPNR